MNAVLARLHALDWQALGLEGFGRPGNYFARQINRWTRQWQASKTREIPEIERLIAWLPEHLPAGDETTIVHGDYRLGNLMLHPQEPRVIALLDWELSTLGHPLADLAYNCVPYHSAAEKYGGVLGLDLEALGIPSEQDTWQAIAGAPVNRRHHGLPPRVLDVPLRGDLRGHRGARPRRDRRLGRCRGGRQAQHRLRQTRLRADR